MLPPVTFIRKNCLGMNKTRIVLGGIAAIVIILAISVILSTDKNSSVPKEVTPSPFVAGNGEKSNNVSTASPVVAEPQEPASPEEKMRQLVAAALSGQANTKKERLRRVAVFPQDVDENGNNSAWGVRVEFNADENLTTNLIKKGIEKQMSEVYQALYTSGLPITLVTIEAYYPLVDKYGNKSDSRVRQTTLEQAEAKKINWSADQSTLLMNIVPGVWDSGFTHPEFR